MEIVLNDSNDFQSQINKLDQSINSENNLINISFNHESIDNLEKDLISFIDWESSKINENFNKDIEIPNILPYFKDLPFDFRAKVFQIILTKENVSNSVLLLNIYTLIKPNNNTFEDDLFKNDEIIIGSKGKDNGIEEFLDFKIQLKPYLSELYKNIISYYLSCMLSLHYTSADIAYEGLITLPIKYHQLITLLDFEDLSKLSSKLSVEDLSSLEFHKIYNSKSILDSIVSKQYPLNSLLESFKTFIEAKNV